MIDHKKEFIKVFKGLSHNRSGWQVWSDLIGAMACSLANAVDHREPTYSEREREYAQCIERLGGVEKPAEAFAIVVDAFERNPDQDFLGSLYMELDMGSHWKGQFFTPYNICQLMADITIGKEKKVEIEKKGYSSVNDCACGAGATLIAAANAFRRMHVNFQNHILFIGQDIDRVVAQMCYIQLSLLGCAGYVVVANTLSNPLCGSALFPEEKEEQEFWYTPFYFSTVWNYRRLYRQMDLMIGANKQKAEVKEDTYIIFYDFAEEEYIMAEKEKKTFLSGVEKLKFEQEQCLAIVKAPYKEMAKKQFGLIFTELIKKCENDKEFDSLVNQEHKAWPKCMKYCSEKARGISEPTDEQKRLARTGQQPIPVMVDSITLLGWIEEYYRLDDKKEEEKKEKAEKAKAGKKKKQEEKTKETDTVKSNIEENATVISEEAAPDKKTEEYVPKEPKNTKTKKSASKKDKVTEGQLSFFDLFEQGGI